MFSSLYWAVHEPELATHLQQCRKQLQQVHLRRARNYYLYFDRLPGNIGLRKGGQVSRLCDLYLDGGQALNGYRPAGVTARLKNVMSRGLYTALPEAREGRLNSLLRRLFPDMQSFGLYHSLHQNPEFTGLWEAPEFSGFSIAELLCHRQSSHVALWRPLSQGPQQGLYILVVPALSCLPLPYLIVRFAGAALPLSDICSPLQMETLILALGQTESLRQSKDYTELADLRSSIAGSKWRMDGIYLYWQGNTEYSELWQHGFAQGFLLPPNPWAPLVLPPALLDDAARLNSEGKRLQKLLQNYSY